MVFQTFKAELFTKYYMLDPIPKWDYSAEEGHQLLHLSRIREGKSFPPSLTSKNVCVFSLEVFPPHFPLGALLVF